MSTRTWHGKIALVDGKVTVLETYLDRPTYFTGRLAKEAPKLPPKPAPKPPAKPKKDDAA